MRLLVTDRGQQSPIHVRLDTGLFKHGAITWQPTFEVPNEIACANVIEFLGVSVIAFVNLCEKPLPIGIDQKFVGTREQTVATLLVKRPGNRIAELQLERNAQIGIKIPLNIKIGAVSDREIKFLRSDSR